MTDCLDDFYLVPVGLQLIGNDLRQRGTYPLPHLGSMTDDFHNAVIADVDVDIRRNRGARLAHRLDRRFIRQSGVRQR